MRLLIIGDLGGQLVAASRIANNSGAKVLHVADIESGLKATRGSKQIDIVFIDVNQDIQKLVSGLVNERINIPVIACGIKNDADAAVRAIKAGAKEYLPLPPQEELIAAIFASICASDESGTLIATSAAMKKVIAIADQIANSEASILITGESGTGKEVIAKYIHMKSKRASCDLIAVNCAAIPENLLESELFGHEKGSFTGAAERRIGKFEAANGSTILLDEISEMDLKLQAKLLRVIQEKEVVRIGSNNPIKLECRLIATSNRDLISYVKDGNFREDLFYRLNVINIELPPLRERKDDIEQLSNYFVDKYAKLNAIPKKSISEEAMQKLMDYNWPGNVREIENCIHRALLLSNSEEISANDIILIGESRLSKANTHRTLEQIEREAIANTIDNCTGDELKASMVLGISVRTLRAKLKQYKLG
ncbi:MAG: sigma-54 dependent transcriptional regulator [Candidatus Jidaibacter sp.]|jgi:DNA-binding NtrC family response regulator|nr:sigma-54 dependent transcriptional regulator [Candidatus Jidaibacter sp.]